MVAGLVAKSTAVQRTALMIFILGAISAIIAMNTGEGAEHVVKKLNDIQKSYIKEHEEIAETFALLSYILGGISLVGLWASFKQKSYANMITILSLVFALVVIFFGRETGTTGGEIRHTEIRNDNTVPALENEHNENGDED